MQKVRLHFGDGELLFFNTAIQLNRDKLLPVFSVFTACCYWPGFGILTCGNLVNKCRWKWFFLQWKKKSNTRLSLPSTYHSVPFSLILQQATNLSHHSSFCVYQLLPPMLHLPLLLDMASCCALCFLLSGIMTLQDKIKQTEIKRAVFTYVNEGWWNEVRERIDHTQAGTHKQMCTRPLPLVSEHICHLAVNQHVWIGPLYLMKRRFNKQECSVCWNLTSTEAHLTIYYMVQGKQAFHLNGTLYNYCLIQPFTQTLIHWWQRLPCKGTSPLIRSN